MRLFASCIYKGTKYYGWQKQPNVNTIEEEIEKALSKFFSNQEINIYGAGRTDAGVHAFGQKFHFDIEDREIDLNRLLYSVNQMLPPDIKIEDIEEVDPDFHARFSAKNKCYTYTILTQSKDPFLYDTAYLHPERIDLDKLREVLNYFVGEHNFKNFTSKEEDESNFIRNMYSIDVDTHGDLIYITLVGNGFMRYMIRMIVGMAIHICDKDLDPEIVLDMLDNDSPREICAYKAPANGLTLVNVHY